MSVTAQKQDISDPEVIHRFATAGRRPRAPRLSVSADLRRHRRHQPEAVERLEGPPARRPVHGHAPARCAAAWSIRSRAEDACAETRDAAHGAADRRRASTTPKRECAVRAHAGRKLPALPARADRLAGARALRERGAATPGCACARIADDAGALEVFVHSPDRDGLFAAIVDHAGSAWVSAIQQARVLDGPDGTIFDTFEVLPIGRYARSDPAESRTAAWRRAVRSAGQRAPVAAYAAAAAAAFPHRAADRVRRRADGRRTLLSLVCTDRPGLLADVAHVLRAQRLRVHDARIATFGERAEDVFQITDAHDRALDDNRSSRPCATRCSPASMETHR